MPIEQTKEKTECEMHCRGELASWQFLYDIMLTIKAMRFEFHVQTSLKLPLIIVSTTATSSR